MKTITLLMATVFFLGVNCFAQNESKFKSMRDNLAKNDVATQDPKKGINPKTWMDRGKLFHDAYGVNIQYMRFNMSPLESKLYFKDPKQILTSEENGVKKETYEYSQIKLNFENDALKSWEELQTVVDDPLTKAVEAYQKATSLDEKGKNAKKIKEAYRMINGDLENRFFNEIALLQYKKAYSTASQRIDVSKLMGVTDTTYYFYAGYAAFAQSESDSSMWQQAVDNFEKAIALNYREIGESKGMIYDLLYTAYTKVGNKEKALKIAQTGFEKHPGYERLMYSLINFYLQDGDNQNALDYLEQAVARDPKNSNLLFAKAKVLDELGEKEKSLAAYDASIAADPKFFNPYFNKAVVYYNSAIKILDRINDDIKISNADFDKGMNEANEEFEKAIPLLEKALEIDPNDVPTMDTLKTLYYRLRAKYPQFEAKHADMLKRLGRE